MCGIFGVYNLQRSKKKVDDVLALKALQTMQHRGPDASAVNKIDENTLLGHLRLSIIDLHEHSNQPFSVDNNNYLLSFNGEIYNYIELRETLIQKGYSFTTSGDTEVLLRAYQEWGVDCLQQFNGMWAFAIYDKEKDMMFCARDRFGVKPFCYTFHENQFVFSSEIKGIITYFPELKKPNYKVIANFCRTSVGAQQEETWFDGIYRLQPSHYMLINRTGHQTVRYWNYPDKVDTNISFEEAQEKYLRILDDAVKLRMRSDVPVGTTLSSGIDSNSIVYLLRKFYKGRHDTYTAYFESDNFLESEKKNYKTDIKIYEKDLVEKVTNDLDLNANFIKLDFSDFNKELEKIVWHLESGHASPAIIPLNKILRAAKKDVTVILEGQGADELIGGYINNNFFPIIIEDLKRGKFGAIYENWKEFAKNYSISQTMLLFIRSYANKFSWITRFEQFILKKNIYGKKLKNQPFMKDYPFEPHNKSGYFNDVMIKQHTGGLVDLLHYGDAISMAHSLESRLPFMDYRLVEFIFTLPYDMKMQKGLGKYIHRKALVGIVPDFILLQSNQIRV